MRVFAIESQRPDAALDGVAVEVDAPIVDEACEAAPAGVRMRIASPSLALAVLGARWLTETEVRTLLGWERLDRPEALIAAYNRFLEKTNYPKVALAVANALWLDKDVAFRATYLDAAAAAVGARPQQLDFGGVQQNARKSD